MASSTATSASVTSSISASSTSPSASSSSSSEGSSSSNPGAFYKNLFYILIGLLCAFGLISFLSLMRARHRRNQIIQEADRLGVLVPGVPGYVPMRDRQSLSMRWARSDGTEDPDWWEVKGKGVMSVVEGLGEEVQPVRDAGLFADLTRDEEFFPLAVIPPLVSLPVEEPIPQSALPFFPNHLAYRASALLPPPSRFASDLPETLNELAGEAVDIITIIRMPDQGWSTNRQIEESEEVLHEWGGVELGIAKMGVTGSETKNVG